MVQLVYAGRPEDGPLCTLLSVLAEAVEGGEVLALELFQLTTPPSHDRYWNKEEAFLHSSAPKAFPVFGRC